MEFPDIELIAEKVHNQWIITKKDEGVTSRKSETGEELMIPYNELSEEAKDLDRNSVKAVLKALTDIQQPENSIKESDCGCHTITPKKLQEHVTKITSLFDAPIIRNEIIDSDDNIIFVESVDVIKDACGTGKLEIFGKTVLLNMCEMEDTIHVNLDLAIDGKDFSKVPFTVKLTETIPYIKLSKSLLK